MNSKASSSENISTVHHGLDTSNLPLHVAVIMDGNGRWAKKLGLSRVKGHEKGADSVRMILRACRGIGISYLTLFAFSTENWQRPKAEVSALMSLLKKFLKKEEKELIDNNIRLNAIGQLERLSNDVQKSLREVMDKTKHNDKLLLTIALSYGGRSEIQRMVRKIAVKVKSGEMDPDEITSEVISNHMYTVNIPDPDLLIRTSGEMRISNFFLWQIAYTELHITKTLWPEFTRDEFIDILRDYQMRNRRYGNVGD